MDACPREDRRLLLLEVRARRIGRILLCAVLETDICGGRPEAVVRGSYIFSVPGILSHGPVHVEFEEVMLIE